MNNSHIDSTIKYREGLQLKYPKSNYNTDELCVTPTQSFLQQWLREIHNIDIVIRPFTGDLKGTKTYAGDIFIFGSTTEYGRTARYNTYEEALEEALNLAFKLITI